MKMPTLNAMFVAVDLSKIPPVSPEEVGITVSMATRMAKIEAGMASIIATLDEHTESIGNLFDSNVMRPSFSAVVATGTPADVGRLSSSGATGVTTGNAPEGNKMNRIQANGSNDNRRIGEGGFRQGLENRQGGNSTGLVCTSVGITSQYASDHRGIKQSSGKGKQNKK